MDSTIEYYEEHAVEFIAETQKLKMDAFYEMFEKYIRPGNMIWEVEAEGIASIFMIEDMKLLQLTLHWPCVVRLKNMQGLKS